jgi:hypothetical protein
MKNDIFKYLYFYYEIGALEIMEMEKSPDIVFPKYRQNVEGIVTNCPLKIFDESNVTFVTCQKCKNFIKLEHDKVLCAISWI